MKNVTGLVRTSGNVDTSNAVECSFDAGGLGHIMAILSNMYTNKHLAVLREYSCNARDAHIEVGQTRPIEVLLPSELQPSLLIQDFGPGLNRDDLINVYSKYGKSTKTDSNDQVGAFGIGSKAAFTMGQQFIVTGVKNGVKTVALFALNENNMGTFNILHEDVTDEPSGVLVSLAVEDVETMAENAARFFSTWKSGTVLVDGHEPVSLFLQGYKVNEATHVIPEHEGNLVVVMGGVSYPVDKAIFRKVAKNLAGTDAEVLALDLADWTEDTSVYFEVAIGDVDIAPSREGLRDSQRTVNVISSLVTGLAQDTISAVQAKVDAARSPYEAAMVLNKALGDLGAFRIKRSSVNFNGVPFKKEFEVALPTFFLYHRNWRSSKSIVGREDSFTMSAERAVKTLVVTGVPLHETSTVSRYAKRFLEGHKDVEGQEDINYLLVSEEASGSTEWFEYGIETGARTMTREEYRAELRKMRDTNPRTRTEPSYSTGWGKASRDLDDRDLLTDILSWGKDIIVFDGEASYYDSITHKALEDYTILVLLGTQSRKALAKRVVEDGSVKIVEGSWRDLVKAHALKVFEAVTDDERAALGAVQWLDDNRSRQWDRLGDVLGEDNITSKVYREVMDAFDLANLVAADVSQERRRELANLASWINDEIDVPAFDFVTPDVDQTYPLVGAIIHNSWAFRDNKSLKAEALLYVNAR